VLATRRGTSYGYSLRELQVYGPGPATKVPAVTVPAAPTTAAPTKPAPSSSPTAGATTPVPTATGLDDPKKKEIALELISSAENSTLNWRSQYGYIEDLGDGRGYTAGIIGFCSGTSDLLAVVTEYTKRKPVNVLARYLPALRTVDGSDSHAGLDPGFPAAWKVAAADPILQKVQEDVRDYMYFAPAVRMAKADGLRALGQFAYYDAAVMHGISGLRGIRAKALNGNRTPAQGGDEVSYLNGFLDARVAAMRTEEAHSDTTRVDTAQRLFLKNTNLDLDGPLAWKVYGDRFQVAG
jgi:chitosanase